MTKFLFPALVVALIAASPAQAGKRFDYSYKQIVNICSKYEGMRERRNCIGHYLADNRGEHYKPE